MSDLKITLTSSKAVDQDVTEAVQIVYDALYHSMDAGSGFLSTEEQNALRHLADAAGFDPPTFPGDRCKCGHTHGFHSSGGKCFASKVIRQPEYERQKRTRLAPAPIPDAEHNRVRALLREAKTPEEVDRIIKESMSKIAFIREEYEVTVQTGKGEREACSCTQWVWDGTSDGI
jgi:hypothetical protein